MSAWDLRLGDCLDPVTGLAALPDQSVDHLVTDPPYDEHTHKCGRRGATDYVEAQSSARATFFRNRDLGFEPITAEQMAEVGRQAGRLARRWVLVFCALEMVSDWRAALEAGGLDYVRCGLWIKQGATPQFTGDRPATGAEAIVIAHRKGRKRWNGGGRHGVWSVPIVLNRGASGEPRMHPTQKPRALLEALLSDFTDPGELILDPFAGSGTTAAAAVALGRQFLGFERDPEHHETARRRLAGEGVRSTEGQMTLALGAP